MVPTFISSLAMMATLAGLANLITDGTPIESFPSWYYFIGSGRIFHIPFPVYLLLLAFIVHPCPGQLHELRSFGVCNRGQCRSRPPLGPACE